jgi:hypothetical protein
MPIAIVHSGHGPAAALALVSVFQGEQQDYPNGSSRHHLQLATIASCGCAADWLPPPGRRQIGPHGEAGQSAGVVSTKAAGITERRNRTRRSGGVGAGRAIIRAGRLVAE